MVLHPGPHLELLTYLLIYFFCKFSTMPRATGRAVLLEPPEVNGTKHLATHQFFTVQVQVSYRSRLGVGGNVSNGDNNDSKNKRGGDVERGRLHLRCT